MDKNKQAKILAELNSKETKTWSPKFPTIVGEYWFYGWCFGDKEDEPELCFVKVWKTATGFTYITNGHFLYKEEDGWGLWQKATLPKLIKPDILKEIYKAFKDVK